MPSPLMDFTLAGIERRRTADLTRIRCDNGFVTFDDRSGIPAITIDLAAPRLILHQGLNSYRAADVIWACLRKHLRTARRRLWWGGFGAGMVFGTVVSTVVLVAALLSVGGIR